MRRHNEDVDADQAEARGRRGAGPEAGRAAKRLRAPGLLELEELLAAHLDTRGRASRWPAATARARSWWSSAASKTSSGSTGP